MSKQNVKTHRRSQRVNHLVGAIGLGGNFRVYPEQPSRNHDCDYVRARNALIVEAEESPEGNESKRFLTMLIDLTKRRLASVWIQSSSFRQQMWNSLPAIYAPGTRSLGTFLAERDTFVPHLPGVFIGKDG